MPSDTTLRNIQNSPALSPNAQDISAMQSPSINPIRGTQNTNNFQSPAIQNDQNQLPANQPDNRPWWRKAIDVITLLPRKTIGWIKDNFNNAKETLFGTPDKYEQVPTKTDAENAFLNSLLEDSFSRLANPNIIPQVVEEQALQGLGDQYQGFPGAENIFPNALQSLQNPQQGFEPYEKAAIKHYQEQTIPSLLESFSGATTSPYIQQHLKNSAQGLETMLNAQRVAYGQQNRQQSLAEAQFGSQLGLNNRENFLRQLQVGSQIRNNNRQLDQSQAQLALIPRFTTQHIPGSPGLVKQIVPIVAKGAVAYGTGMI